MDGRPVSRVEQNSEAARGFFWVCAGLPRPNPCCGVERQDAGRCKSDLRPVRLRAPYQLPCRWGVDVWVGFAQALGIAIMPAELAQPHVPCLLGRLAWILRPFPEACC
eukprot:4311856-Alexandrium_andersonii.AAC.1